MENIMLGRGAVERPIDIRDFHISTIPATSGTLNLSAIVPTIYMQNQEPACGAHMAATIINILNPGVACSPEFIWDEIRILDGLPPTAGSDIRTVFKAMKNNGAPDLALMPNNTLLTPAQYAASTNITRALAINAMPRCIKMYGFGENVPAQPITWGSLQQTIALYGVVGCRIHLGTGFYTPSWNPSDILPLKLGTYIDDHFIALISPQIAQIYGITNPNPNFVYFVNSWSNQWGQNGIGWFDASYISQIVEIGACA